MYPFVGPSVGQERLLSNAYYAHLMYAVYPALLLNDPEIDCVEVIQYLRSFSEKDVC